jgi:hypothetical protein
MDRGRAEIRPLFISAAEADDAGMTPLLFTLALLTAPPAPEQPTTAGQLYDGCVSYAAQAATSSDRDLVGEVVCAAEVAMVMAVEAADAAMAGAEGRQSGTRRFCLPESLSSAERDTGAPLVQAFIAYVDRNPASRELEYDEVFQRALAEKWPCPR